jgi:aldose 1-epimerase
MTGDERNDGIIQINGMGMRVSEVKKYRFKSVNSDNLVIPSKFMLRGFAILFLTLKLAAGAGPTPQGDATPDQMKDPAWKGFRTFPDGGKVEDEHFGTYNHQQVRLYTLTNKNGVSVSIMDFGATIVRIITPDRNGKPGDIALGFDHFAPYLGRDGYLGATVGRFANRIAKGKFTLGKTAYQLPCNNGVNSLHGGTTGFNKRLWKTEPVDSDEPAVRFSRESPDGEEDYPGNLYVSVTFSLNNDNELRIAYTATTDQPTIINLTNHTYFNLGGAGTILDDFIRIHADSYTPVDATQIPTGEIKPVGDTPFDLRNFTRIGAHLKDTGGTPVGYDHNFVLNKGWFSNWAVAAEVFDPQSGRMVTVSTDQPGVQFYTGNVLDGTLTGKGGQVYRQYDGFTLETQHYPDSPNHDNFPSTVLMPGDTFTSATVYKFGLEYVDGI